jgi:hypothetical protein
LGLRDTQQRDLNTKLLFSANRLQTALSLFRPQRRLCSNLHEAANGFTSFAGEKKAPAVAPPGPSIICRQSLQSRNAI